jgi:hypothetical protein
LTGNMGLRPVETRHRTGMIAPFPKPYAPKEFCTTI